MAELVRDVLSPTLEAESHHPVSPPWACLLFCLLSDLGGSSWNEGVGSEKKPESVGSEFSEVLTPKPSGDLGLCVLGLTPEPHLADRPLLSSQPGVASKLFSGLPPVPH